jgi:hypothetical protein
MNPRQELRKCAKEERLQGIRVEGVGIATNEVREAKGKERAV